MGSVADCDKSAVLQMATITREMILLSVKSLQARDRDAVGRLYEMDDKVDELYRKYLQEAISPRTNEHKQISEPRCFISALLILRYLERISDHACYVGDSVYYIITGTSRPRR
jgi:phosphate transport system protein